MDAKTIARFWSKVDKNGYSYRAPSAPRAVRHGKTPYASVQVKELAGNTNGTPFFGVIGVARAPQYFRLPLVEAS